MLSMKTCNFIVALITAAVGAAIAWTSYGYGIGMSMFGPGAGFWPFLLGVALIVIAALIVADSIRHGAELNQQQVILAAPANLKAYAMMGLVAAYIACLTLLGFYVASFLFVMLAMYLLGMRRLSLMLTVTLIFLAAIFVIFGQLLHISLPMPFFME